ncbi:MAG: hypothetical protein ABIQ35_14755 [Verrucomicrobiota bacterium]
MDQTEPARSDTFGTFTANNSGGQTLVLTPYSSGSGPDAQINLHQVRDITSTLAPAPGIRSIAVSGATLTLIATNGPANGFFVLLQSGNIALPVSQWTRVVTNSFDGSGNTSFSANIVNPSNPQQFYILRTQP